MDDLRARRRKRRSLRLTTEHLQTEGESLGTAWLEESPTSLLNAKNKRRRRSQKINIRQAPLTEDDGIEILRSPDKGEEGLTMTSVTPEVISADSHIETPETSERLGVSHRTPASVHGQEKKQAYLSYSTPKTRKTSTMSSGDTPYTPSQPVAGLDLSTSPGSPLSDSVYVTPMSQVKQKPESRSLRNSLARSGHKTSTKKLSPQQQEEITKKQTSGFFSICKSLAGKFMHFGKPSLDSDSFNKCEEQDECQKSRSETDSVNVSNEEKRKSDTAAYSQENSELLEAQVDALQSPLLKKRTDQEMSTSLVDDRSKNEERVGSAGETSAPDSSSSGQISSSDQRKGTSETEMERKEKESFNVTTAEMSPSATIVVKVEVHEVRDGELKKLCHSENRNEDLIIEKEKGGVKKTLNTNEPTNISLEMDKIVRIDEFGKEIVSEVKKKPKRSKGSRGNKNSPGCQKTAVDREVLVDKGTRSRRTPPLSREIKDPAVKADEKECVSAPVAVIGATQQEQTEEKQDDSSNMGETSESTSVSNSPQEVNCIVKKQRGRHPKVKQDSGEKNVLLSVSQTLTANSAPCPVGPEDSAQGRVWVKTRRSTRKAKSETDAEEVCQKLSCDSESAKRGRGRLSKRSKSCEIESITPSPTPSSPVSSPFVTPCDSEPGDETSVVTSIHGQLSEKLHDTVSETSNSPNVIIDYTVADNFKSIQVQQAEEMSSATEKSLPTGNSEDKCSGAESNLNKKVDIRSSMVTEDALSSLQEEKATIEEVKHGREDSELEDRVEHKITEKDLEMFADLDCGEEPTEQPEVRTKTRNTRRKRKSLDHTLATENEEFLSDLPDDMQENEVSGESTRRSRRLKRKSLEIYRASASGEREEGAENCQRTVESDETSEESVLDVLNEIDLGLNVGQRLKTYSKKKQVMSEEELERLYRNKNYQAPAEKKWETIFESPNVKNPNLLGKRKLKRSFEFDINQVYHVPPAKQKKRIQRALKHGWNPNKQKSQALPDEVVVEKIAKMNEILAE